MFLHGVIWNPLSECHLHIKPIYLYQYLLRGGCLGKGLFLWNVMPPAVPLPYLQPHIPVLSCPVWRVQPPHHHKLPPAFIPGHYCCCFGTWNSRSLPELMCREMPLLPTQLSPLLLQVERQPCMDLPSPHCLKTWGGGGRKWTRSKVPAVTPFCTVLPLWCQFSNGKYFTCHHKGEILQGCRTLLLEAVVK